MSRFHSGQLCFSISCCHRGPNTFSRISGSLTPIPRLPFAGAEESNVVLNAVACLRLCSQDHERCKQVISLKTPHGVNRGKGYNANRMASSVVFCATATEETGKKYYGGKN